MQIVSFGNEAHIQTMFGRVGTRHTPKFLRTSPRSKKENCDRSQAKPGLGLRRNKVVRKSRQMLNEIGREPTPEELAEKLGMPFEKVRKVLKIAREPLSLETPIGDEEDSHLGDFIEDKNAILPIDAAIQSSLRETTTRVLASVTPPQ